MWRDLLAIAVAFGSSGLYSLGVSFQATEAARVGRELSLLPSLLGRLARRRRWLVGAAISLAGWQLQALALLLAPLTVVQPALAAGLVILIVAGGRLRGQAVARRQLAGLGVVIVGIAGIAAAAPERTAGHASPARLALAIGTLALLVLVRFGLRALRRAATVTIIASAGLASAWSGLATKLVADELALRRWPALALWLAVVALAAALGLLSETSALQLRTASQVVPAIFVIQIVVPVLLAPYLAGERWTATPAGGPPLALALAVVVTGVAWLSRAPAIAAAAARSAPPPGLPPPTTAVPRQRQQRPRSDSRRQRFLRQ